MRRDGRDAHYVNLIAEDPAYLSATFGLGMGNPLGLPGVHECWLEGAEEGNQHQLTSLVHRVEPDVVLAFGFPSAFLMTRNVPDARTVLMTGSCRQAAAYVTTGRARSAVELAGRLESSLRPPRILVHSERLAVEQCDLVITHSRQTLDFMTKFFPASIQKIYPRIVSFAEWIVEGAEPWKHLALPFGDRDIDALFVANDWDRGEKNFRLVERIARLIPDFSVHVVGDAPSVVKGVTHHGFVASRSELFGLIGRARCVVSPSRIDAAPGILFEGAAMGSNIIASENCGNADMCNPALLASSLDPRAFAESIRAGVLSKYEDGLEAYLALASYDDLMATIDAFARPFESAGAA